MGLPQPERSQYTASGKVQGTSLRQPTTRIGVTSATITMDWATANVVNKILQRHRVTEPLVLDVCKVLDACLLDDPTDGDAPRSTDAPPSRPVYDPTPRLAKVGDRVVVLRGATCVARQHIGQQHEVVGLHTPISCFIRSDSPHTKDGLALLTDNEYRIVDPDPRPLAVGDLVVATDAAIRYRGQISRIKNIVDQAYDEQIERRYFLNLCKYTGFSDNQLVRVLPAPI